MNDPLIRKSFHDNFLSYAHHDANTLVIDELGIEHGKSRVDIAVINGHIHGYEIKSDIDSLNRLKNQILFYNKVLDRVTIILTENHFEKAMTLIPDWWGIVIAKDFHGKIKFQPIRPDLENQNIDDLAVANLLWKREVQEILSRLGLTETKLRKNRAVLYSYLVELLDSEQLRELVRFYVKNRKNWRRHEQQLLNDDSSLPYARS